MDRLQDDPRERSPARPECAPGAGLHDHALAPRPGRVPVGEGRPVFGLRHRGRPRRPGAGRGGGPMKLAVHYMKPEWFREGIMGVGRPDPADLAATHIFLTTFEAQEGQPVDHALEDVFLHFQAEVWSPNGEARSLIE